MWLSWWFSNLPQALHFRNSTTWLMFWWYTGLVTSASRLIEQQFLCVTIAVLLFSMQIWNPEIRLKPSHLVLLKAKNEKKLFLLANCFKSFKMWSQLNYSSKSSHLNWPIDHLTLRSFGSLEFDQGDKFQIVWFSWLQSSLLTNSVCQTLLKCFRIVCNQQVFCLIWNSNRRLLILNRRPC